jgi:DNA-binding NarL/FixJ family response regulator
VRTVEGETTIKIVVADDQRKLHLGTRAELVRYALDKRLIEA